MTKNIKTLFRKNNKIFIKIIFFIFIIYFIFSIKAYFSYRYVYQNCDSFVENIIVEKIDSTRPKNLKPDMNNLGFSPNRYESCKVRNSQFYWKILFPFKYPVYPGGIPVNMSPI